jgi:O-antigen ligase
VYVLLAFIPLVIISPYWATIEVASPILLSAKTWTLRILCAGLFVLTAIRLALPAPIRLGTAALPAALLALMLGAAILSSLVGADARASLRALTNEAVMILAALFAPLFLTTRVRIRLVMLGILAAVLTVSGIVFVSSWLEDGRIVEFIYGRDILRAIREGDQQLIYELQGGLRRGGSIATLGNPEFTGTYLAVGFLLAGCGLLHGWGSRLGRSIVLWPLWLVTLAFIGSGILATGTRGALVAVAIGLLVCWLGSFRLRGWIIAAGLAACTFSALLLGFRAGASMAIVAVVAALVWQIRSGQFMPAWRAISWPNRALLFLAPLVMVAGLTSQSVPGPWNIGGATMIQRMTRETNVSDNSIRERITFWMMAGEIVAERPLLGAGEGMFGPNFHASLVRLVEADETGTMAYAQRLIKTWLAFETHNDYFEIAADRGLIGLGLFLAFGVALLGALSRLSRDATAMDAALAHALLVTLAGFHAIMASGFPLQTPARMTTFFLVVGLSLSVLAMQRPTEVEKA